MKFCHGIDCILRLGEVHNPDLSRQTPLHLDIQQSTPSLKHFSQISLRELISERQIVHSHRKHRPARRPRVKATRRPWLRQLHGHP